MFAFDAAIAYYERHLADPYLETLCLCSLHESKNEGILSAFVF
jgi:hypothetical protein